MRLFNKFKKLGIVITIFILTMILSGCENSLQIGSLAVNTTINKDGSVKMEEAIAFHYSDGKEPITKNIYFPDGSEVKDLVVSDNKGDTYKLVTSYTTSEISKVYKKTAANKNLLVLEIYSPDNVEDETYKVTYTLANIATKYSDSGHFVWTYVGRSTDVTIGKVSVNINFENKFYKSQVRVDLNGPLKKNVEVNDNGIKTYVDKFPIDTLYEVSVLFPNDYIANSNKTSTETIKDKVATTEEQWIAYDNARTTNTKIYSNFMIGILALSILFTIYFYFKYCRKDFKLNGFKIYRELPKETSPAIVKRFLNARINALDVAATALDMVRRGYIEYLPDTYVFTGKKALDGHVKPHEKIFMNFFLNVIGKKRKLIMREIEINKINESEVKKIRENYVGWKRYVDSDKAKEFGFKNNNSQGLALGWIYTIIIILAITILSIVLKRYTIITSLNILAILYLMYIVIYKRKKTNEEDFYYDKFMGFKAFLRDKESLVEVLSRDISLAEKYLPYAISLGVHKEFIEILKNNIKDKTIPGFEKLTYLKLQNEYYFQGIANVIDIIERYLNDALVSSK